MYAFRCIQEVVGVFLSWCLLCLNAGDDQRGTGSAEGLVL